MNVKRALKAPVLLPYLLRAMNVSINPAINGEIIYMILNPKITRLAYTQITADINPSDVPINTAAIAHFLSVI
jgi:hypothetical protein